MRTGEAFTLQTMLDFRTAAEAAQDAAERRRHLSAFSAYADSFVAHVPRDGDEAVEALLLARYFSFLPQVAGEITDPIRADLEAALEGMKRGDTTAEVLDPLWRVLAQIDDAARHGRWVDDERDMPIAGVTRRVLGWARGALLA